MFKRLLLVAALGAALVACTPAGAPAATVAPSVAAPTEATPSEAAPSEAAPSESTMPIESASPAAS